jgi:Cu+-exporting ATPase
LGYEILTLALKPQRLYASTHTAAECNKNTILLCRKKREQILKEIIRVTRDVETVSSFISSKDNGHREIIYVDFVFKNHALKSQLLNCLKASHYRIIPYQKDEEISYINAPLLGNKPELSLFMEEYDMKSTISIQGMTCSSCISIIEDNIRKINGIDVNSASVSLFPPRLTVEHSTEMVTAFDIMNQIQQMGFECELIKTEPLVKSINSQKSEVLKVFINGMTCTSCSHGISQGLAERDGIINVDINLVTNIGTIEYQPARVGIRDILQLIENMGFDVALYKQNEHAVESKQTFSRDALICLIFVIPAFFIEMIFMMAVPDWEISWFFMQEIYPGINLDDIIMLILATPVQFILGFRFCKGAYKTFRYLRSANMDTLVAIGTLAAYLFSIYSMIENFLLGKKESDQFFETVIFLIFFILIGKYLEHCAKGKTTNAVKELYDLTPDTAELVTLDSFQCILTQKKIPLELVQMGDFLKVSAGSKIPCDGVVLQGSTYVDESMITGESLPVHKDRGSRIIGGTVNLNGPLIMKVLAVGSESTLTRIINLMQDAQSNRAPIQEIADKVSKVFVPTVILISCITFIVWIAIFSIGIVSPSYLPRGKSILNFAVEHAVAVLVIACPCALGLATPTAIMVGSGSNLFFELVAAKYGILIKGGGAAMEYSSKIKTVVFDKTGTLTVYNFLYRWESQKFPNLFLLIYFKVLINLAFGN